MPPGKDRDAARAADRQERSSNNDIIGDRDFSIATSSVQSSVLKSSKFLADKAQNDKRKVMIDETKSTPKDSSSQKDQNDGPGPQHQIQQAAEPAVQYSKKNTIRRFSTLKNDDNY